MQQNQFILIKVNRMIDISSIAHNTLRQQHPPLNQQQQLQLVKINVALFIATVDNQLTDILHKHHTEMQALRAENQELKSQLKTHNKSIMASNKSHLPFNFCQTSRQHKPYNSISKFQSQEKSKDFYECGLSEISLTESKSLFSDNKKSSFINYVLGEKESNMTDRFSFDQKTSFNKSNMSKTNSQLTSKNTNPSSKYIADKQNEMAKQMSDTKCRLSVGRKHRREASVMDEVKDRFKVGEVLLKMRVKMNEPEYCLQLMSRQCQKERQVRIVPGMFKRN